jgi:hypothetical protein
MNKYWNVLATLIAECVNACIADGRPVRLVAVYTNDPLCWRIISPRHLEAFRDDPTVIRTQEFEIKAIGRPRWGPAG